MMAYRYNDRTGEFEEVQMSATPERGSRTENRPAGNPPVPREVKAGRIVLWTYFIISIIILLITAISS